MSDQTKKPVYINRENFTDKIKSYLRHPGSMILMFLVMLATFITFALLLFLIFYILINGIPYIKPSLFSLHYTSDNASVIPALINTVVMHPTYAYFIPFTSLTVFASLSCPYR